MRLGVLYQNKSRLDPAVAAAMAYKLFRAADHTRGHDPKEVHFNPAELPGVSIVYNLVVVPDREVPRGHVRVTTINLPEEVGI